LYLLANIIKIITTRLMRCTEELHAGGRIILKWILKEQDVQVYTRFIWLRTGTSGELL
jgi:hypothetical protein